ncbi:MAG: DUF3375 domain-containing protein [Pseudomonadota bacterium]|nr:DUF3375 domain-containing protein [Pseudomonadota bacterium]
MPRPDDLDFDYLVRLKRDHPTLRLLAADNAPLIIGFLNLRFVRPNRRAIPWPELASALDDYLFHLREIHGQDLFPRTARQYLTDWSEGTSPYLRRYYTERGDEPELDLTPATEKAIEWLRELEAREFVGTESRLLTVFELLREMVLQTEQDPQARIAELERRKQQIDAEIEQVRSGRFETMDPTRVRERFHQAEDIARRLLADFRQVEHNFRELDRSTRERIALGDQSRGATLDRIFAGHDEIHESDQGRSFRAFWEFLMSPARQAELDELLEAVYGLDAIEATAPGEFLRRIRYALLEAGEKVFQTNNRLVEQLRKYLDDQAWLENKRIMELIRGIERQAVSIRNRPPDARAFAAVDELRPGIDLVMSRGLYEPSRPTVIDAIDIEEGEAGIEVDALFRQVYIDEAELEANIRRLLQKEPQVSLARVVRRFPVTRGIGELVGYLNLASRDDKAMVDVDHPETLEVSDDRGRRRRVQLPRVVFVR